MYKLISTQNQWNAMLYALKEIELKREKQILLPMAENENPDIMGRLTDMLHKQTMRVLNTMKTLITTKNAHKRSY